MNDVPSKILNKILFFPKFSTFNKAYLVLCSPVYIPGTEKEDGGEESIDITIADLIFILQQEEKQKEMRIYGPPSSIQQ